MRPLVKGWWDPYLLLWVCCTHFIYHIRYIIDMGIFISWFIWCYISSAVDRSIHAFILWSFYGLPCNTWPWWSAVAMRMTKRRCLRSKVAIGPVKLVGLSQHLPLPRRTWNFTNYLTYILNLSYSSLPQPYSYEMTFKIQAVKSGFRAMWFLLQL